MKITILSDQNSWKNSYISGLAARLRAAGHRVDHLHQAEHVKEGNILFILGFFKIIPPTVLKRNSTNAVVHESALPKGRGWSPMTWLILAGAKTIPLTLFEAVEKVDAGVVYLRASVPLQGDELLPQIREKVGPAMMNLCAKFVARYPGILKKGKKQSGKPTYYPRRTPQDAELDPRQTLAEQFDLLRTVDNANYPAFFRHRGAAYTLRIEKKLS